jgi:hypothetical protein
LLCSIKYIERLSMQYFKGLDPDILVLHALVHILVLGLVAVAEDIAAAVVQQRAAETSNRHLEQRLLLQVTYCTVVAADRRPFVGAAEVRPIRHLEQTQMLQMAYTTAAFAEEDTVVGVDSFGIVRREREVTVDWFSVHRIVGDIAAGLGTVFVGQCEVEPEAVVDTAAEPVLAVDVARWLVVQLGYLCLASYPSSPFRGHRSHLQVLH